MRCGWGRPGASSESQVAGAQALRRVSITMELAARIISPVPDISPKMCLEMSGTGEMVRGQFLCDAYLSPSHKCGPGPCRRPRPD